MTRALKGTVAKHSQSMHKGCPNALTEPSQSTGKALTALPLRGATGESPNYPSGASQGTVTKHSQSIHRAFTMHSQSIHKALAKHSPNYPSGGPPGNHRITPQRPAREHLQSHEGPPGNHRITPGSRHPFAMRMRNEKGFKRP